jgi:hypothetical protein
LELLRTKRRARLREQQQQQQIAAEVGDGGDAEEDEQMVYRRREREAEYGSMAVRGRMNVSGRGRRRGLVSRTGR